MKIRKTKKGFTIVELVIVIAVIGVLTAILVPTFISLTAKANKASDQSLVANLNTALKMQEAEDGAKNPTMHDAVLDLDAQGFNLAKLVTKSKEALLWNSETNQFELEKDQAGAKFWKIYDAAPTSSTVSVYAKGNNFGTTVNVEGVGFDAGYVTSISTVNYTGGAAANEVVIRTNGGALTIDGASSHVEHYGLTDLATITAVSDDTYVEHGTVISLKVSADQKVVIKETAVVVELDSQSEKVTSTGYIAGMAEGSKAPESGDVGSDIIKITSAEQLQGLARASTYGTGNGVVNGKTIQLQNDIDLTKKEWVPFGLAYDNSYYGTIDGNNHKIIGLSNELTDTDKLPQFAATSSGISGDIFGLVGVACAADNTSIEIKNLTMENVKIVSNKMKGAAALVGVFGDKDNSTAAINVSATFTNVTVSGELYGKDKIAGFIGGGTHNGTTNKQGLSNNHITFENCVNEAKVEAFNGSARAAGFIGQYGDGQKDSVRNAWANHQANVLKFKNCANRGTIKSSNESSTQTWVGDFVAHYNVPTTDTMTTLVFEGNNTGSSNLVNLSTSANARINSGTTVANN